MTILYVILIIIAGIILFKGADLTIKSLIRISRHLKWSPFIVSFIFVAVATSLPEIFVAFTSGRHKISSLSLGNVIGANIINLTLILGLCAVLAGKIKFQKKILTRRAFFSLIIAYYPILLVLDGTISRLDGLALMTAFFLYLIFILHSEKKDSSAIKFIQNNYSLKDLILLLVGLGLLVGSAEIIIRLAQSLATTLNLSLILTGLILVSLGTTLPELVFGLKSVIKKQAEFSLGTSLGTIVANSTLAVGLAAILYPIQIVSLPSFLVVALFFLLTIILFYILARSYHELSWQEGVVLIIFYFFFIASQVLTRNLY